jgi:hypothetical protein
MEGWMGRWWHEFLKKRIMGFGNLGRSYESKTWGVLSALHWREAWTKEKSKEHHVCGGRVGIQLWDFLLCAMLAGECASHRLSGEPMKIFEDNDMRKELSRRLVWCWCVMWSVRRKGATCWIRHDHPKRTLKESLYLPAGNCSDQQVAGP